MVDSVVHIIYVLFPYQLLIVLSTTERDIKIYYDYEIAYFSLQFYQFLLQIFWDLLLVAYTFIICLCEEASFYYYELPYFYNTGSFLYLLFCFVYLPIHNSPVQMFSFVLLNAIHQKDKPPSQYQFLRISLLCYQLILLDEI